MPRYLVERTFPDGLHIPVNDDAVLKDAMTDVPNPGNYTWVVTRTPKGAQLTIAAVGRRRGFKGVAEGLRSGWGTLLKPIAWQGDLVFGPSQGPRVTFTTPEAASARWAGLPQTDGAARTAIRAYLGAYGPATVEAFSETISGGWFGRARMRGWFFATQ